MTVSHLCTDRDPVFVRMDIVDSFSHAAVDRHRHHRRSGHVFTAESLSIAMTRSDPKSPSIRSDLAIL
jgi:hypothetical protein